MSDTRYIGVLAGDDIAGPFTIVLVVGREGESETFTSISTADDLLGVRQYLYDALSSRALHDYAKKARA